MKIEISIWGIRRGFEKEGFFHTHNNAAIKASQQDRFRKICNSIGNKGFFNIQHIQGKTPHGFLIKDKIFADTFREVFDNLWKDAKE